MLILIHKTSHQAVLAQTEKDLFCHCTVVKPLPSAMTDVVMNFEQDPIVASDQFRAEKALNDSNSNTLNHASFETGSVNEEGRRLSTVNVEQGEEEPKRQVTGFRWFLVCVAIFSGNILYGLDTTIAADIQASVSESFNNVTQLGWLGVGFTLGSTVTILPLGKAYARFDNKWMFISCLIMFSAGSALCGAALSMSALIVGRVWAGAGGAGVYLG